VDETDRYTIPFAPVSFTVDLLGQDHKLNIALSYKVFTEKDRRVDSDRFGFAVLLVVADVTGNALFAYDLCCPYEDSKIIKVKPRSDGKAECPECGSVYFTMYGSTSGNMMYGFGTPEKGPSSEALQSYRVILQNGVYHLSN
jgi:nitrite reductase/ring-hydroxylating ferredoxin subunit